jgi:alkylhydroperoxidase/carboxymuconolactone decarboxylase family protein YurZ
MALSSGVGIEEFSALVAAADVSDGEALPAIDRALIQLGLACALPSLNKAASERAITEALALGATAQQIQEIVSLMAGLGVHSLMLTSSLITTGAGLAERDGTIAFTSDEQKIWDARVGSDPFWNRMEDELPGFLRSMLKLSPAQFEAFFDFCAVPWKTRTVSARTKELLAMASDAMPSHRFMPGFRLHLANAIKLGAGRRALDDCLQMAAHTPAHVGVE